MEHGAGSCLQSEPGQGSPPHPARRTRTPERGNESQVLPGWEVQPPFSRALHTTVPHAPGADDVARKLQAAHRAEVSKNLHQGQAKSVRGLKTRRAAVPAPGSPAEPGPDPRERSPAWGAGRALPCPRARVTRHGRAAGPASSWAHAAPRLGPGPGGDSPPAPTAHPPAAAPSRAAGTRVRLRAPRENERWSDRQ